MRFARALILSFLVFSSLSAQVFSPKVLRKGQVDASDLKSLVAGIYGQAGARTDREKAEAIWRFFLTDGRFVKPGFWYHIAGWAYEEPGGEVLDPVKLMNSYGFGLCYQIAPLLEAAFKAGGFSDSRVWFLTGHTVTEVFYDGAYHYYDSDMLGYNPVGKGDPKKLPVASVHQIERDVGIMLGKLKSPTEADKSQVDDPWYPADVKEAAMEGLAELFSTTKDNWLFPHTRFSQGHTMDFVLRPGERMIRYYKPEKPGLYYLPYKYDGRQWSEFPREVAQYKIRTVDGPHSQRDGRLWGTGVIEYKPPVIPTASPAVIEVSSPYVIIDAEFTMRAAMARGEELSIETSTDGGRAWFKAGEIAGAHNGPWKAEPAVKTTSEHGRLSAVSGTYGYLVRLTRTGGVKLQDFQINTRFQLNPRTLPELQPGRNEMVYSPGAPQRRRVLPIRTDQVERVAFKTSNYRLVLETGQSYAVARDAGPAEFLFELSSPDGVTLSGFDAGGRFLDIHDNIAPDKLTAETRKTALRSTGTSGKRVASLAWSTAPDGEFRELWSYDEKLTWRDGVPIDRLLRWPEVDRQVRTLPPGTRKVYVRYSVEGLAIDDFRLATVTPARPGSQLTITHVWREGGQQRTHEEKIVNPRTTQAYAIEAGPGAEPEALILECR